MGATRLASLVGRNHALKLLASAQPLTGKDCLSLGLADEVASSPKEAPDVAIAMLDSWTGRTGASADSEVAEEQKGGGHAVAIRGVKRVISRFDMEDGGFLDEQLAFERKVFGTLWGAQSNVQAVLSRKKSGPTASGSETRGSDGAAVSS
ncbi:enoyl CoA hydratase domain-containing protein 1 [Phlyctochytrium bullatum]|nr:enoyl CoA hydratase domain-containing protein 1 [Phlyctochytrium bullatum]